jgi:hypothetical protein
VRAATAARFALGGACLASPARVLDTLRAPDRHDPRTQRVTRVLGARLVVQGVADLALGAWTRRPGIAVDLAHAASMLPLAVISEHHRRSALASAACAAGIAALDRR